MKKIMIDVRERDEYAAEHIAGSLNLPLTELHTLSAMTPLLKSCEVVLICRSGSRATMAKEHFDGASLQSAVYAGGILAWKSGGNPTQRQAKTRVSLFRQVQIIVGAIVTLLSLGAFFGDRSFALGAAAIGSGLIFAGVSGICMLANVLKRFPWNKVSRA